MLGLLVRLQGGAEYLGRMSDAVVEHVLNACVKAFVLAFIGLFNGRNEL